MAQRSLSLGSALSITLAACGGSTTTEPPPPPPGPLVLRWPVTPEDRTRVTRGFGEYISSNVNAKYHSGIDIGRPIPNAQAVAVARGTLIKLQRNDVGCNLNLAGACRDHGVGNTVLLRLSATLVAQYSHLEQIDPTLDIQCDPTGVQSRPTCSVPVADGQVLGTVGNTGYGGPQGGGTGPHLHFEMKRDPIIGIDSDDGATGWGYARTPPRTIVTLADPMMSLHQGQAVSRQVTLSAAVDFLLGPGNPTYPAAGQVPAGANYVVLAEAVGAGCSPYWVLVAGSPRFTATKQNFGEFPDAWVCPITSSGSLTLSVGGAGTGSGNVSSNVAGITCSITAGNATGNCSASFNSGTSVTLTATPASGHTFAGWSGACTGTGFCQVTMTQARSVTASFTLGGSVVFAHLAAGVYHTCGLTSNGVAYCWGQNQFGQLGDGTRADRVTPRLVQGGVSFVKLAAGGNHTCGLTSAGQAYCWGTDALGNGMTDSSSTPRPVLQGSILFVELAAGEAVPPAGKAHTCGRTSAGQAYCWGWNYYGQLGDGTTTNRFTPTPVLQGNIVFVELTAGAAHTCGRTSVGQAYCWGSAGGLGDGTTTTTRLTPTLVQGGIPFVELTAGGGGNLSEGYTCGLTSTGQAYCWGDNFNCYLGDGCTTTSRVFGRLTPTPVLQGNIIFVQLTAGGSHTCGRTSAGQVYCWGLNIYGQLGDDTTEERATPVLVKSP